MSRIFFSSLSFISSKNAVGFCCPRSLPKAWYTLPRSTWKCFL